MNEKPHILELIHNRGIPGIHNDRCDSAFDDARSVYLHTRLHVTKIIDRGAYETRRLLEVYISFAFYRAFGTCPSCVRIA